MGSKLRMVRGWDSPRVPRARKNIYESMAFKSLFPCDSPPDCLTLAFYRPGVRVLAQTKTKTGQKDRRLFWCALSYEIKTLLLKDLQNSESTSINT